MTERLRLIILGEMGRIPFPGMSWELLQYLEGFRRLGHEVWYVEDTNNFPYDPEANAITWGYDCAVRHIARHMEWLGMPDRWAYRAAEPDCKLFGMSERKFSELFEQADVLINHAACTTLQEVHMSVPVRVLLETDPGFDQIRAAKCDPAKLAMLSAHTHFFTWAENYGGADCRLPAVSFAYAHTRMPVVLDWFRAPPVLSKEKQHSPLRFTTVGNWRQSGEETWQGERYYYSKEPQFLNFLDVPKQTSSTVELALSGVDHETVEMLAARGWRVVAAAPFGLEMYPFRDYILASDGEFTVAKDVYARLRTGWFSDRSCYYLTAGRPVVTQDTGFGVALPTGEGLFAFNCLEDVKNAFEAISADYARHRRAAREIAAEYFRAETVLARLLKGIGV